MNITSIQAALLLQSLPGIGNITTKKLVDHCGNVNAVFEEKKENLLKIRGIGTFHLKGFSDLESYMSNVIIEEEFLKKEQLTPLIYGEENYPLSLSYCADSPLVLFQKGKVSWDNERIISLVGTRTPTSRGIDFCKQLIEDIADYNPLIISGFARGIDIVAHKTALNEGLETVACLAHGLNQIYPMEHKKYVQDVCKQGALLSEFWSTSPFDKSNFLKRNRIIAGLAHATIIIESGEKGGSLTTAKYAHGYGRDVYSVPGRITDAQSKGCLDLIRTEKARMITSASELIYWMGWEPTVKSKSRQKELFINLTDEETVLYNILDEKKSLDQLASQTQLSISKVASVLFQLEMKDCIRSLAGKQFERV